MRWLGNIIISIAVQNLDGIYSYMPFSVLSSLSEKSTITVLKETLRLLESGLTISYHKGRTVVVEMYVNSDPHCVKSIKVDSCLDPKTTKVFFEQILKAIQ